MIGLKRTKKITLSALFCALSVVVLLVGSFLQVADIALSMLASAILMLALIEMGQSFAVMIYFATSLLSLLFLPSKFIAAVYLVFSGLYPLIKRFFDAKGKVIAIFLKLVYFNLALALALVGARFLFPLEVDGEKYTFLFLLAYFAVANIAFWLFDLVLQRGAMVYMVRYRHRFRRFFK